MAKKKPTPAEARAMRKARTRTMDAILKRRGPVDETKLTADQKKLSPKTKQKLFGTKAKDSVAAKFGAKLIAAQRKRKRAKTLVATPGKKKKG